MTAIWTLWAAVLGIAAVIIVGSIALRHSVPRRRGPLPPDPGLRKPPDLRGEPFR